MKRTAAIAAAGFVLLARVGAQQAPQPTTPVLRASVDQVVVDVVVTDEHGGVVPGLTAADFEIVERGQPQTIGTFAAVSLPLVRPLQATAPGARDFKGRSTAYANGSPGPTRALARGCADRTTSRPLLSRTIVTSATSRGAPAPASITSA